MSRQVFLCLSGCFWLSFFSLSGGQASRFGCRCWRLDRPGCGRGVAGASRSVPLLGFWSQAAMEPHPGPDFVWTQYSAPTCGPSARHDLSAVLADGAIWMFGGGHSFLSELWRLDTQAGAGGCGGARAGAGGCGGGCGPRGYPMGSPWLPWPADVSRCVPVARRARRQLVDASRGIRRRRAGRTGQRDEGRTGPCWMPGGAF